MIKVGERLVDVFNGELTEYVHTQDHGREIGVSKFKPIDVLSAGKYKSVAIFGVPGAFTPTCSEQHLPNILEHYGNLLRCAIDEVWCVSVNDVFVLGAWVHALKNIQGKSRFRMVSDGNGEFTRALGLTFDLTAHDMGIRSKRYSMLLSGDSGRVVALNVENGGEFKISNACRLIVEYAGATDYSGEDNIKNKDIELYNFIKSEQERIENGT